jgi:hypothetical protein
MHWFPDLTCKNKWHTNQSEFWGYFYIICIIYKRGRGMRNELSGPRFGDSCSKRNQTISQYRGLLSFLYFTWITVVHCIVGHIKFEGEKLTLPAVKYASLLSAGPTLSRRSDLYDELCVHITPCEQIIQRFVCLSVYTSFFVFQNISPLKV